MGCKDVQKVADVLANNAARQISLLLWEQSNSITQYASHCDEVHTEPPMCCSLWRVKMGAVITNPSTRTP